MKVPSSRQSQQANAVTPSSTTFESPTSPNSTSSSSRASRHLVGALNTRKIGVKHRIKLKKAANGFGIKIAERDNMHRNRPIYITAITTTGSAYQDGRLREGDMLLEVNGIDIQAKTQPEVTRMLKSIKTNEEVEFLVSRQEDRPNDESQEIRNNSISAISRISSENNCDTSLIDLDVPDQDDSAFVKSISDVQFEKKVDSILNVPIIDGPGFYTYDIPLNDTKSAGLGLYIKYPCRADQRRDLGVRIEKVITGGAAWKDGRLQPNDQILAINGITLVGLSNAKATETLTAAVSRGIGPEAKLNTIRLRIHRRSPSAVAKILQVTNTRIESSDTMPKSLAVSDKNTDNSRDSYQTAFDRTLQDKGSETRNSSGSSNQNSQNDSAMSPQTQASNSLKLTNSCNDRSEQSSSDKTNETTSSAISQITDFVPNNEFVANNQKYASNDGINTKKNTNQNNDSSLKATKPKSICTGDEFADYQNIDPETNLQFYDDESVDAANSEDHFQRDGFGRQSISEKRHAQLNAKNTDTFRKNQRLREEREQQQQQMQQQQEQRTLEEQMARQRLDADTGPNCFPPNDNMRLPTSYTTNEFKSIYGLQMDLAKSSSHHERLVDDYHREVPVDVLIPHELKNSNDHGRNDRNVYSDQNVRIANGALPNLSYRPMVANEPNHLLPPPNRCAKCGSTMSSCMCRHTDHQMRIEDHFSAMDQRNDQMLKRSNSLESVQQNHIREDLIIPRAGTVRVARNRKVNESFRAAVDRSYEANMNGTNSMQEYPSNLMDNNQFRIPSGTTTKLASSIGNSTTSTSNEERHLITSLKNTHPKSSNDSNNNNNITHKKSSSFLTKFLKFGSIKRKKNKNAQNDTSGMAEVRSTSRREMSSRDSSANTRSQAHERSHSRTQSTQSHPDLKDYQMNPHSKSEAMMNGQMYNHNLKQAEVLATNHIQDRIGPQAQSNRTSMPMCQYQLMHNTNTHHQIHPNHLTMTQAKYSQNDVLAGRHAASNLIADHQPPHSHNPMHHNQQTAMFHQQPHHMQGVPQHPHVNPLPIDQHSSHYSSGRSTHMMSIPDQTRHVNARLLSNGCSQPQQSWQPPPPVHFQASNGLWVANSSSPPEKPSHLTNIYGTLAHHQNYHRQSNIASMQQPAKQQPLSMTSTHDGIGPIFPTTSGPPMNGVMHQAPINNIQYHNNQMRAAPYSALPTHQYPIHGSQQPPQQIYYYDF